MNTANSSSLIESSDFSKIIEEVDIGQLLSVIGEQVDIGKLLPILGEKIDITKLLSIIKELDLDRQDIDNLKSIFGENIDIDKLLSILSPGGTLLPIDNTNEIDETFSFILPEETVKLLDGLLLEVLPVETLAAIDAAIDIDRLFSITLPIETFSVVSDAILSNEAIDIDALLSTILPDEEFPPVHENGKGHHHGHHDYHQHHNHKHHHDKHNHHQDDDETNDGDQTFSFILPEETVKLLDGLLLETLSVETLAKIDEAIDIDKLFSIKLPTETFSVVSEAIKNIDAIDIDAMLSTILSDGAFPLTHENNKDHNHGHHDKHMHQHHNHIHHQHNKHKHHDGETSVGDQTFSFILPEETVKFLDGLLLEILPIETLAKIDKAIDIDKLFSITLPTETFSVVSDAIINNEPIEIDALLSTILSDDGSVNETFSFIVPEETLEIVDGLLFDILPPNTLAQIDNAIQVERLFSIELPIETFQFVNNLIINNHDGIEADIKNILATILPNDASILTDEEINIDQSFLIPEVSLI